MRRNKKKSLELKLDLHGITYNKIEMLLEEFCFINTPPFKIVTGNSNKMKKYSKISNNKITKKLYSTYDLYLNTKYKIDINQNTLERVKNYFK